jgi:homoserine dehydrogenase
MKAQSPIDIIILGFGIIGQELTRQIHSTTGRTRRCYPNFHVIALADSKALFYRHTGLVSAEIQLAMALKKQGASLKDMDSALPLEDISTLLKPNTIVIDTTASSETLPLLRQAIKVNSGIVLANKIPLCQPWAEVQKLYSYPLLKYEATVGAGLPIISTLKYLLDTGDKLESIVGCLSGTLGYLCSCLEEGVSYSQAIRDAHALGYTEPDPRQDLGGMDVARKAIILSRTAGIPAEISDLTVEPLFPSDLGCISVDTFLEYIHREDDRYAKLVEIASANQKVPRYTARITAVGIQAGMVMVDKTSSLGSLKGTDNFIALNTHRYSPSPLVISGPGAGIEVTAAGVFGDIIQLGREMLEGGKA